MNRRQIWTPRFRDELDSRIPADSIEGFWQRHDLGEYEEAGRIWNAIHEAARIALWNALRGVRA